MIYAMIIDDEENNRNVLQTLLKKHCPGIKIVGETDNADEAFLKINACKPHLIFLDIKMPQKSGFDLLKMFTKIDFDVIFTTAHDNYALRAFEFNALDYIVKPISAVKLIRAVEKARNRIRNNNSNDFMLHFIRTLSDRNDILSRFSIHHNGKVIFINLTEISFIEALEGNSRLNLSDNTQYYSSKRLADYEEVLGDANSFIRINKNVIINIDLIKSYSKGDICLIDMKSGQSFEVSRRRKTEILKKLKAI